MTSRVLIIAGSDSGGGAGIQADIKTVTMLGGYAATAITALTAQNTLGVFGIIPTPPEFIKQQIELVLADIGADAIKTGMLHNREAIETVSGCLAGYPHIPLVVDPVMVSTSGHRLLEDDALEALIIHLISKATIVTPNIPEAEMLTGHKVRSPNDMLRAGERILKMGAKSVLVKGGHAEDNIITDVFVTGAGKKDFLEGRRINTTSTHGTGCTLASAIACGIAMGKPLNQSVAEARLYVRNAIRAATPIGKGRGPLKHNFS